MVEATKAEGRLTPKAIIPVELFGISAHEDSIFARNGIPSVIYYEVFASAGGLYALPDFVG